MPDVARNIGSALEIDRLPTILLLEPNPTKIIEIGHVMGVTSVATLTDDVVRWLGPRAAGAKPLSGFTKPPPWRPDASACWPAGAIR